MRRMLGLAVTVLAVFAGISGGAVAFANPASAPGAGDPSDVANVRTGQDVSLPAVLNTSPQALNTVIGAIVAHNPLCSDHATSGDHA